MLFHTYKDKARFTLVVAEGLLAGTLVGVCDSVRMRAARLNPTRSILATGEIAAVWGIEIPEGFDMSAALTRAVGIGKVFAQMFKDLPAVLTESPPHFLCDIRGAILRGTARELHLEAGAVRYTLQ